MDKQQLFEAFRALGIEQGMTLEVHSSLCSFGHVEGGAEAVIAALQEAVGAEGSIFMPSLRISHPLPLTDEDKALGITSKLRILPEDAQRTGMGVIADTFRSRSDTATGGGIFRITGWGRHAEEAVKGGLDYAIHNGGMALLLGVDIYRLTAMHYVEEILPGDIGDIFAPTEEVNAIYPPDEWMMEAGAPPVKPWYTIQDMAYQRGLIRDGYIGNCRYMFFNVAEVIGIYRQELERDPYGLYGLCEEKG